MISKKWQVVQLKHDGAVSVFSEHRSWRFAEFIALVMDRLTERRGWPITCNYDVRPKPPPLLKQRVGEERVADPMTGNWCAFCLIPSPAGKPPIHKPGCYALDEDDTAETRHDS